MKTKITPYQWFVVAVLAFMQFTIILDFMILSPLGVVVMPALKISPAQFGTVVSAYAFSAGISGLLAAGFADRYDRKKLLLLFYTGFVLGTLFCGLAWSYELLVFARMFTGFFGGVIGSVVMAITTDLFALETRGRVMGVLQTSFAASQVLGIPMALYFSNHWGWQSPFLVIVGFAIIAGLVIAVKLRPIDGHLKYETKSDMNAFKHLFKTIQNPRHHMAFALTALLSTGGFMLMPFGSTFTVQNLGVTNMELPFMYLLTGLASIFMGPFVGWAADKYGKFNVFMFGAASSAITVMIYTHLGKTPFWEVVVINIVLFVSIFSRMIPAQAITSAIPALPDRGAFMAVSSSLQQVSGGIASVIAGMIVMERSDGSLGNFPVIGYVVGFTIVVTMFIMFQVTRMVSNSEVVGEPKTVPSK